MTRHRVQANHLLNFSLPERETPTPIVRRKKKSSLPTRTREEFLQANFRFVVQPVDAGEFVQAFHDPNAMVEWDRVEQVQVHGSPVVCPICLDTPVAPKITGCGHIFCWSCILRYLSMSDTYWRRCPMCFDSVTDKTLRSVGVKQIELPPRTGTTIEMKLLERRQDQLFPAIVASPPSSSVVPYIDEENSKFARIILATSDYIEQMVQSELDSLRTLRDVTTESYDHSMIPFIDQAEVSALERLKLLHQNPKYSRKRRGSSMSEETRVGHYLYQLKTGEAVILHSFNMKCLLNEFTADALPLEIEGRVLDSDVVTLTEKNQSRYRFLRHLPLHSEFYVCEIDISAILSDQTRKKFAAERKKRERVRQKKLATVLHREIATAAPKFQSMTLKSEDRTTTATIEQKDPDPEELYSLANITAKNGYYPSLNETSSFEPPVQESGVWGRVKADPPPAGPMPRGKKGKRISLLSTTQQRSYR